MGKKKAAATPTPVVEEAAGVTVEQHLKDLGLLGTAPAEDKATALAAAITENFKSFGLLAEPPKVEVFEVDLFDSTPIGINGNIVTLPKGRQQVSKQVYGVLKDANLIK